MRSTVCSAVLLAALVMLIGFPPAAAQAVSDADRIRGYAEQEGQVTFVFDPAVYGLDAPDRVVVTGAFRAWSTNDSESAWQLAPGAGGIWTLTVDAEDAGLGPASPFKFRADGRWLDPPAGAVTVTGGNLTYRFGEIAVRMVAELRSDETIWVQFEGMPRPTDPSAYSIVRWDGAEVPVGTVIPNGAATAVLTTDGARGARLEPNQVHYVEVETASGTVRGRARFDGLWRDLAGSEPLGATVAMPQPVPAGTAGRIPLRYPHITFRLFAPRADSVHVHLYQDTAGDAFLTLPMQSGTDGVWTGYASNVVGAWYDFSVFGPDGPGSAFTNQTGETVSDPYALVSDDSWGRARIWHDSFDPPQPVAGGRPAMEDVIAYEVHLQDFTDELPVGSDVGPLESFAMPGLTNTSGEPIGIDYLEELGVNVVHLMPVQEYLHYPDAAWGAAFGDDPFMIEQGVATENYQWGYRTTHALAVESRFRSAGDEPGRERQRFRDLVDAFHARGMAVIVDVVFNHTGENMEGVEQLLTFNGIDKWYYYRLDDDGNHIGAFGNEVKSENRPYTQRWLLDQLRHYVEVFGVDGFRIDLAGQTDEQTLRWLQSELGEDVLIYGEPWIGSNDPDYEANPDWDWYKVDSPITFFQDDSRNAWKGSPLDDPTPAAASRGFSGGDVTVRDDALAGVANDYPEEPTPNAGIGYLDIHDNWALADRFASCRTGDCRWDGREGVRAAEMRIGSVLLMTSLGPIVMHGGTEIARSKGVAPLAEDIGGEWERTEMSIAPIYIKGRGDTYNLRTANAFVWETVGNAEGPVDHAAMFDWWQQLIAFRLGPAGESLRTGDAVPDGYVRPILRDRDPGFLGYVIDDQILVMMNVGKSPMTVSPPNGLGASWRLIADSDAEQGRADADGLAPAGPVGQVRLGPKSVRVWARM